MIHIANAFVEWELSQDRHCSLYQAFHQHPVFLQLQFLPILYAASSDILCVSDFPEDIYWEKIQSYGLSPSKVMQLHPSSCVPFILRGGEIFHFPLRQSPAIEIVESGCSIEKTQTPLSTTQSRKLSRERKTENCTTAQYTSINSWGASRLIAQLATDHALHYNIPPWEILKKINSKAFSFSHSPILPGATLLHNEKEALQWLKTCKGNKVIKTVFGSSGRGHFHIRGNDYCEDRVLTFLKREWNFKNPVIAEPWVDRIFDFSTQWMIEKNSAISYIGATICINDANGQYCSTKVGDETCLFKDHLDLLEEHKVYAIAILKLMQHLGYFGHVGIDAMIYKHPNYTHTLLHPVVEINARKTMGWTALAFQRRFFPDDLITMSYTPTKTGILPSELLLPNGKWIRFTRNLHFIREHNN